ncbi:C3HC zinc finger-like-domain-containing protein [Multifurca ochricompacta]|uniref:C3HC zinc finger-like-domain-containing protein n=1 Tax=Multifurca ochricompacta TaxID=376703 RepID=A0AAD4QPY5_9AGAM|nr:C3HC zinc finger-like-domain-containing protein [Multifurca ochricompacta]
MQLEHANSGPSKVMPNTSNSPEMFNKRKLDDALQSLDDAMGYQYPSGERPTKRPHLVHSLYSTLAKYGIKTKEPESTTSINGETADLSKTPHLAAILSRAAAKSRKVLPIKFRAPTPISSSPTASYEYRPSSTQSFLGRLATYKLNTYANKPTAIDAVAAAKCGWVNDGKDRLVCGICKVSWVLAGREGMNRDAANSLVEKQRIQLVDMHKDGCPWKKRQCDANVYRIHLSSPAVMAREIRTRACSLEFVLEGVEVKHPLSSMQVQALSTLIASIEAESSVKEKAATENAIEERAILVSSLPPEPSPTAILTSLFGWSLVAHSLSSTSSSPSLSRASSVAPRENSALASVPQTPRRLPGLSSTTQFSTPTRMVSSSDAPTLPWSPRGSVAPVRRGDTPLLHCSLCHRRLGLWVVGSVPRASSTTEDSSSSAQPPRVRQIDLLREHRPYCPYVVRSTTVPSLPVAQANASHIRVPSSSPLSISFLSSSGNSHSHVDTQQSSAVEGWRAILMVVLRYRMGQWQRRKVSKGRTERVVGKLDTPLLESASAPGAPTATDEESWVEVDPVEAMVEGVKSRGGTELLRYVKGLLG